MLELQSSGESIVSHEVKPRAKGQEPKAKSQEPKATPQEPFMHTIDHLGIAVKSLAQARKFYEQLGLEITNEETVPHEKVKVAMIQVGHSRIELLEATSSDSVIAKFVEKRGEGLHHVAIQVPDLKHAVEMLKA